jgi:hypothetical protein
VTAPFRVGQKVFVRIPSRGVPYPARVIGLTDDGIEVQIELGYRYAAGVEFITLPLEAVTA